jgi:hypothetical protein
MKRRLVSCALLVVGTTRVTRAQQATPAVHPVGAIVAKTTEPIGQISGLHVLSDGRVVLTDNGMRRVLLFDSTLTTFSVLLDATGATPREFPATARVTNGLRAVGIPYLGDSTVFYDPVAVALVVLDPNGRIVRVASPPFPPDAGYLLTVLPFERFDPAGRLLYLAGLPSWPRPATSMADASPDSAPIVRATPGGVAPETLAYVRTKRTPAREPFVTNEGVTMQRDITDPFSVVDGWAMLHDGTIAIVRGQDYHVDWIAPDGKRTSSPRLPFQWHRLSDSEKVVITDSVKAFNEANPGHVIRDPAGRILRWSDGVITPDSLADYRPPLSGAVLGDADGNIWTQPTPEVPLSPDPGRVFDVVNRAGKLIDRVLVGPGFGVVGFSPGYIFMQIREGATTVLVKARIR